MTFLRRSVSRTEVPVDIRSEIDSQPDQACQSPLCSFVAARTANTVAVLRTLPAIVMSVSDTGGCCSASPVASLCGAGHALRQWHLMKQARALSEQHQSG
jgi:hypothetical protein